jgi:hypothetical protein
VAAYQSASSCALPGLFATPTWPALARKAARCWRDNYRQPIAAAERSAGARLRGEGLNSGGPLAARARRHCAKARPRSAGGGPLCLRSPGCAAAAVRAIAFAFPPRRMPRLHRRRLDRPAVGLGAIASPRTEQSVFAQIQLTPAVELDNNRASCGGHELANPTAPLGGHCRSDGSVLLPADARAEMGPIEPSETVAADETR